MGILLGTLVLLAAGALRIWAGLAYAEYLESLPPAQRAQLMRLHARQGV